MNKGNGKSEAKNAGLDLDHELPAGDGDEATSEARSGDSSVSESELQKLRAERDSLLDRLARAQAEFENARRRASKEQQEFRDYAVGDAIKSLLPVMGQPGARAAGEVRRCRAAQRCGTDLQATASGTG